METYIGKSVKRREDNSLLKGAGKYTDELTDVLTKVAVELASKY